jgi:hypothetical protein
MLKESYIYGENKALNTIFCFHTSQFIFFVTHSFQPKFMRMERVTDFYTVYRIA